MLTQNNLKKIQGVIKKELQQERAEIRKETQDIVRTELTQARKEIRKETQEIVKEELTPVKDNIAQVRKDIKTIVNFFWQGVSGNKKNNWKNRKALKPAADGVI